MPNTPIFYATKYLGIQIDRYLTLEKHVDAVIKKVSHAVGLQKRFKNCIPPHLLKNVYASIVELHLRYCSSAVERNWINCKNGKAGLLES